jgi:HSP20 family molecular chaperone IbpA
MDTLINTLLRDMSNFTNEPVKKVESNNDVYTTEVELAGFAKNQIKITATEQRLTVKAKNKTDSRKEVIRLNNLVSLDHIVAEYKHGLLKLTLPKKSVNEGKNIKIT